jgi:glycosyltransferase involved in cell wall biosynthesis
LIKGRTGRPWVADFRDPWIGNVFAAPMSRPKRWMQRRMERWIVERADVVTVAVELMRVQFAERYPELAEKFVHIPNGYDRADLIGIEPAAPPRPGGFHVLYAGSLYRPKELEAFLLGVERLLERRPDLRERLRVDFVGRVNEANVRVAAEFEKPSRLGDVVSFEGFMPRPRALARMLGADALVQLMPDMPGAEIFVGGKLSEYLAFDRPILAVMPPGEGRALVEGLPTGIVADVEPGSVADALERLLDHPPAPAPADPTGRFDRVNLAGELARVMDRLVGGGPSDSPRP